MRFPKIAIFEVKELLYFPRNTLIEIQVIFTNEILFLKIFAIFSIWGKCIVSPLAHLNEEKQSWNVNHSKFAAFLDCVHAAFNCNFVFGHSCLFISPLATLFPDLVTLFHSPSKIKCYQTFDWPLLRVLAGFDMNEYQWCFTLSPLLWLFFILTFSALTLAFTHNAGDCFHIFTGHSVSFHITPHFHWSVCCSYLQCSAVVTFSPILVEKDG